MKNKITISMLCLFIFTAGCGRPTKHQKTPANSQKNQLTKQYTCTMHPKVLSDKPGICPYCGMELVENDK